MRRNHIPRTLAGLAAVALLGGCTSPTAGDLPPDRRTGAAGISAVDPRTCASRPPVAGRPGTTCDQRGP